MIRRVVNMLMIMTRSTLKKPPAKKKREKKLIATTSIIIRSKREIYLSLFSSGKLSLSSDISSENFCK